MKLQSFYFIIVLMPIFSFADLTPLRCAKLFDRQFENILQETTDNWDHIINLRSTRKRESDQLDRRLPIYLEQGIQLAESNQILWEYADGQKDSIRIIAHPNGSELNRLATGLQKNMGNAEMIFDPKALYKHRSSCYLSANHCIFIDTEVLSTGYVTPDLTHELRHAFHEFKFRSAGTDEWAGYLSLDSTQAKFNAQYDTSISLDELVTFSLQLHNLTSLWKKILRC